MFDKFADWVPLSRDGETWRLSTVIDDREDLRDPVVGRGPDHILMAAARKLSGPEEIVLSHSSDGKNWQAPQVIAAAQTLPHISVTTLSRLASKRYLLAGYEWQEKPGEVSLLGQTAEGLFHYQWTGFSVKRRLVIWISSDGTTWKPASVLDTGPFLAVAPCGKAIETHGKFYLMVYGPTNKQEMDAALSTVGWMESTDGGDSWKFSHLLATADHQGGVGYGPGDAVVLPDGRWLALLQKNVRRLGDYPRPRICRTVSTNNGKRWSLPEDKLLGPAPTLVALEGETVMYGSLHDSGVFYGVSRNAGRSWDYLNYLFDVVWYNKNPRGGLRLHALDAETVYAVFHWMKTEKPQVAEIKGSFIKKRQRS